MHDDDFVLSCPVCGKDCDALYYDMYGDCVGCSECIRKKDYLEMYEEEGSYA